MKRSIAMCLCALAVAGCGQSYSPQTYSSAAVQQVNKVETGLVVGFRQVKISASGTVGAVTGGAAGGVLGSRSGAVGIDSALGTVGGTAIGTIIGTTVEHVSSDAMGWEYIVRKSNGELLSVTQSEAEPLALGQKVLVIAGNQARIVPDYSVEIAAPQAETKPETKPEPKAAEPAKSPTLVPETHKVARPAEPPLLVVPLSSDYAAAPPAPAAAPQPEPAPAEPAPVAAEPPQAEPQPAAAEPAQPDAAAEPARAEPLPPETAEAR